MLALGGKSQSATVSCLRHPGINGFDGGGCEVTGGHSRLQSFQSVRGCVRLAGAALQEGHPNLLHLSVFS